MSRVTRALFRCKVFRPLTSGVLSCMLHILRCITIIKLFYNIHVRKEKKNHTWPGMELQRDRAGPAVLYPPYTVEGTGVRVAKGPGWGLLYCTHLIL